MFEELKDEGEGGRRERSDGKKEAKEGIERGEVELEGENIRLSLLTMGR